MPDLRSGGWWWWWRWWYLSPPLPSPPSCSADAYRAVCRLYIDRHVFYLTIFSLSLSLSTYVYIYPPKDRLEPFGNAHRADLQTRAVSLQLGVPGRGACFLSSLSLFFLVWSLFLSLSLSLFSSLSSHTWGPSYAVTFRGAPRALPSPPRPDHAEPRVPNR